MCLQQGHDFVEDESISRPLLDEVEAAIGCDVEGVLE
jgi:hypothetical protein